jgi:hypothetical protein
MGLIEQLSAVAILVDFLFGIAIGLVLSVSCASLREDSRRSLLSAAPGPLRDGVRVFQGVYIRGGYRSAAHRVGPGGGAHRDPGGRDPDEQRTEPDR